MSERVDVLVLGEGGVEGGVDDILVKIREVVVGVWYVGGKDPCLCARHRHGL